MVSFVLRCYTKFVHFYQQTFGQYYHRRALKKVKGKDVLRCVFFATFEETWKYEGVYRLMKNSKRFDPIVLVCPIVNYGFENMIRRMDQCYTFFKEKGYVVQKAYDCLNNRYVDVRKELNPDIVFYTNPYEGLIDHRYFIHHFKDILTVYVPYFFNETADFELAYNEFLHNVVWRRYLETNMHKKWAVECSRSRGRNVVVTGYPGIEPLIYGSVKPLGNAWKIKDGRLKRIIWAPHHSIYATEECRYASFLIICDVMVEMAKKYRDQVQFAFKPHPVLRNKLETVWGKEKTNLYYEEWAQMPNTALVEGDYVDLFLSSDAMIHDSGSFIAEYLCLNKPVIRTLNGVDLKLLHNEFGLQCLENHYMAHNAEELDQFIQNVIHDVDPMKEARTKFIQDVLIPERCPSQSIIDDILDSIENQIVYRN